jgi:hypothetical protein
VTKKNGKEKTLDMRKKTFKGKKPDTREKRH